MAANNSLNTVTSSGTQSSVESPQTSTQAAGTGLAGGTPATIQSGTPTAALTTSDGGIPLKQTNLSTVSVNTSVSTQARVAAAPTRHAPNAVLLGFVGLLFVIAIASFWLIQRGAKNTTKRS